MEKRELIPRIARWWLRIQEFDIDIVHRAGTQMNHVDALSREMDTASLKIAKTIIDEEDWLFSIQLQDEKVHKIVSDMKLEKKSESDEYMIEQDRLFRKHFHDTHGPPGAISKEFQEKRAYSGNSRCIHQIHHCTSGEKYSN